MTEIENLIERNSELYGQLTHTWFTTKTKTLIYNQNKNQNLCENKSYMFSFRKTSTSFDDWFS